MPAAAVPNRQLASATPAAHQAGQQRVAVLGGAVMSAGRPVVADHRAYRLGAVPVDIPFVGSGLERQPLVARPALAPDPNARLVVGRHGAAPAIGVGPAVGRVGYQLVDRSVPGPAPHDPAVRTPGGQVESVFEKPQQRLAGAAQLLDLVEDQRNRLAHSAVRVLLQTIAVLHVADRGGDDQLAAPGLLVARRQRTLPQQVELVLVQRALQSQQQPIVALAGRVDGLLVHQNRVDHPAHLDQLLPVPAVAGEPRRFPGGHRADLAETDLRHHAVESGALRAAGRRAAEIVVDGLDPRKAQPQKPVAHRVLQRAALAVVQNLMHGRLTNVQDRLAFQMMALDLVRHHRSPRRSRSPLPRPGRRDARAASEPSGPSPAAASGPADRATAARREVGCRSTDRTDPTEWTSGGTGA